LKYLAKNLKWLRERRGIKQSEIEAYIGFKSTTWNNYEKGVSKPGLDDLVKMSKYFGVTETQLLHKDVSKLKKINTADPGSADRYNNPDAGMVNEDPAEYKRLCEIKDKIIEDKDKIIQAQQGQIDALKLATSQMEKRLEHVEKKKK
jgi:transcriptional regulator with XRE-family HTH domain